MKLEVNDQVHLSAVRPTDKAFLVEHLNDREIYDRTLRVPYPYTEEAASRWLSIVAQNTEREGRPIQWVIRDMEERLIGGCGFDSLRIGKSHSAEIGYWLARPYWGKGIMTAVVRKACDFAFAEFGLIKIIAHVFDFNVASARVLEKSGFELEGYLKKHFNKHGRYIDAKLYGLLNE
jgi:RimJ/RimL family protein N-acetyltransferase